jgi:TniQ
MISSRWPLHPRPVLGESLSSWLGRTAARYGMTVAELLSNHNLGYPGLPAAELDVDPPLALLETLATRTGFPVEEIRALSLVSWVPLLLDGRDPVPGSFPSYVGEWSVLLPPTAHARCDPAGWRPWLRPQPLSHVPACRTCLGESGEPFVRLHWQLPLMASCPIHGLMLEPAAIVPGVWVGWERDAGEQAPAVIRRMDARTWDALTSGGVDLPRRRVHAAIWFRLLRTLLDELNRPLRYTLSARGFLAAIWDRAGGELRAGQGWWRPFEVLAEPVQRTFLQAAATAMAMIEADEIQPRGILAGLFRPQAIAAGDLPSPSPPRSGHEAASSEFRFNECHRLANELIVLARRDPVTARELRDLLRFGRRDPRSLAGVDALLSELGARAPGAVT